MLYDVTAEFDVPLMVTRGYPSISYLYDAAEAIAETDKPAFLYYFGDYDPSGCDITRAVESGIREFAPDADIHFERVAVTQRRSRPGGCRRAPRRSPTPAAKASRATAVEVDSIPPATLRNMVRNSIVRHIDARQMRASLAIEEQERETLRRIISNLGRTA